MEVELYRKYKKETYTIGEVYIDGEFFCHSIEDIDRGLYQYMNAGEISKLKVYGETAIPYGSYKVTITYSPKYKRNMPQVMNVVGFSGIRIHSGNSEKDSLGCILLGNAPDPENRGWVSDSRKTCKKFEEILEKAGGTCNLYIK